MKGNDLNEIDHGPFTRSERAGLRRVLQDDHYKRRRNARLRTWLLALGTVVSFIVPAVTVWRDVLGRLWK